MSSFDSSTTRSVMSVSLLPSTIQALNQVVNGMGGRGNRSRWIEEVILRALKEDWDIEIVKPLTKNQMANRGITRQPKWEPSQKQKDEWQKVVAEMKEAAKDDLS